MTFVESCYFVEPNNNYDICFKINRYGETIATNVLKFQYTGPKFNREADEYDQLEHMYRDYRLFELRERERSKQSNAKGKKP